jgi:hypothetical protein
VFEFAVDVGEGGGGSFNDRDFFFLHKQEKATIPTTTRKEKGTAMLRMVVKIEDWPFFIFKRRI